MGGKPSGDTLRDEAAARREMRAEPCPELVGKPPGDMPRALVGWPPGMIYIPRKPVLFGRLFHPPQWHPPPTYSAASDRPPPPPPDVERQLGEDLEEALRIPPPPSTPIPTTLPSPPSTLPESDPRPPVPVTEAMQSGVQLPRRPGQRGPTPRYRPAVPCPACGVHFVSRNKGQKTCSGRCGQALRRGRTLTTTQAVGRAG